MNIVRIVEPTPDDFRAAADVCELRWPYLKALHTPCRFEMFEKLGVELVVAREGAVFTGVCFVLPCRCRVGSDVVEWVSLFQLASRPEAKNVGGLLMMRIMSAYPAIISMGVTDEVVPLYKALRWKYYGDIWRGVHPIDLRRMAADYSDRLSGPVLGALRGVAGVYNAVSRLALEPALSLGLACRAVTEPSQDPLLHQKERLVASCFGIHVAGADGPAFTDVGGVGRVLSSPAGGWASLRHHAAMWRQLRLRNAKLCEILLASPDARRQAMRRGYIPLRMPAWYMEKNGAASKVLEAARLGTLSFLHTDKSV
jgi:hypothetical protein